MLAFAERMDRLSNAPNAKPLKSQISNLKSLAESCSRQLRAWADALQHSDIKGQRHLTEASQSAFARSSRFAEFMERLQHVAAGAPVNEVFSARPCDDSEM